MKNARVKILKIKYMFTIKFIKTLSSDWLEFLSIYSLIVDSNYFFSKTLYFGMKKIKNFNFFFEIIESCRSYLNYN